MIQDLQTFGVARTFLKMVPITPLRVASAAKSKGATQRGPARKKVGRPGVGAPTARVLVVDDHLDARLLLEEYLQQNGLYVSVAKNGAEALALLRGGIEYDLVLLDLDMPHVDGYGFIDALRRFPPGIRNTPVVVLSGYVLGKIAGAVATLDKPAPLDDVLATIQKSLRKHRA